jgi:hypothetical protein
MHVQIVRANHLQPISPAITGAFSSMHVTMLNGRSSSTFVSCAFNGEEVCSENK